MVDRVVLRVQQSSGGLGVRRRFATQASRSFVPSTA
jgi:hypothetical protein